MHYLCFILYFSKTENASISGHKKIYPLCSEDVTKLVAYKLSASIEKDKLSILLSKEKNRGIWKERTEYIYKSWCLIPLYLKDL